MQEAELHDLSDDADYAASMQQVSNLPFTVACIQSMIAFSSVASFDLIQFFMMSTEIN